MSRDKKSKQRWRQMEIVRTAMSADDDLRPEAWVSFPGLATSYNFIHRIVDNYIGPNTSMLRNIH